MHSGQEGEHQEGENPPTQMGPESQEALPAAASQRK